VRYRSGDIVRVVDEQCACGRLTPRIRLLGRADSMFIVRGVNVFPQAIEALLDEVVPRHGPFAVLLDQSPPNPPIPLIVELDEPSEEVTERIRGAVRTRLQFACSPRLVPAGALGDSTEQKSRRVFRTYLGEQPPLTG